MGAQGSQTPLTSSPSFAARSSRGSRSSQDKSRISQLASTSSLAPSSIYRRRISQSTLPSSLSNGTPHSQNSIEEVSSSSSKSSGHAHWCTVCEQPKVIKTCDGWKRHMREHETIYPCMPNGPVVAAENGPKCCFCHLPYPDQNHLDTHSVSKCHGGYEKAHSYTRKANMVRHLKAVHNASEANASTLADIWRDSHKNRRRFFSCGFCISIFFTVKEQNSHIETKHWSQHQDIRDWDTNRVILGLLLQPGVSNSWQELLARHHVRSDSDLSAHWNPTVSEYVQLKLEIGQSSAQALAELAFKQSSYCRSHQVGTARGTAVQPSNEDLEMEESLPVSQKTAITMQAPQSCSAPQLDSSSGKIYIPNNQTRVGLYRNVAANLKSDPCSSQYGQLQPMSTTLEDFPNTDIREGADYDQENLMGQFELPLNETGDTMDFWNTQAEPWTPFTPSERQIHEGGGPNQALFGKITQLQGDFNPTHSPMPPEVPSDHDAYRPESLVQNDGLLSTGPMDASPPSMDNALPIITINAPVRKRSSRLVVRPKRKLSGLKARDYQFEKESNPGSVIDTGQHSQYRYDDDNVRSRRRIESQRQ